MSWDMSAITWQAWVLTVMWLVGLGFIGNNLDFLPTAWMRLMQLLAPFLIMAMPFALGVFLGRLTP